MKKMIKIFIFMFLVIVINQNKSQAQILLLPDQQVSYEKYSEKCHLLSYKCTMNYDLESVQNAATPKFDYLIENLDYLSDEFQLSFMSQITEILKNETLSFDQIEIVLKIIRQIKNTTSAKINSKKLTLIESELSSLYEFVQKNQITELKSSFMILFKKPVDPALFNNLKTIFLKVPIFYSRYNQLLVQQNSSENQNFKTEPLLTGRCENAAPHPKIQSLKWQAFENEDCHFFQSVNPFNGNQENRIFQPKTLLITSALVLGAALLLNQYEVKFEF